MSEAELSVPELSEATRARARRSLRECGFVYLDNFLSRAKVQAVREAYEAFKRTAAAKDFVYPCQGEGRIEHMLPFAPPFNDSTVYADRRLLTLLGDYLGDGFKMELMTVINSPPGTGHQRWHQGWRYAPSRRSLLLPAPMVPTVHDVALRPSRPRRYLFHPDERLPPYAVVVALPLSDVAPEQGPTEMCPGKKRRLYYGWRCTAQAMRMGSSAGTVVIFDYKTLHRGPANEHATEQRPMVSMVFSRLFFMNTEALVNRGISLLATLHMRRYIE